MGYKGDLLIQRGTIIRRRASWTLVCKRKRVVVSKKLAAVSKEYPTKTSVRHLADKILAPLNEKAVQSEKLEARLGFEPISTTIR
jgi:hypothetical protein